ncbi:MAG: respiratory nitrite reductase specific menaquinol--cytochrome-c reductase (NrfH) precursor [Firmicutes bacterium]|nr:respiratory nitrite reductase specific menaquinol--cytochrome-c reductase (NrfH) precursor [Bacillota bacterium]
MKKILLWLAALMLLGFCMMLMTKIPALGLSEAGFCGKCHAMDYQVSTYLHSSHAREANCGDCHDPHGLVTGSVYAAYTGSRDVYRVVTNTTPAEIRATEMSKKILQENCLRCHSDIMRDVGDTRKNGGVYCFQCHQGIVHPK